MKLIAPALAVEDVVTQTCEPDEIEKLAKPTGRPDLRPVQLFGANGWGGDPTLFDQSPGGAGRHVRCAIYVDGFFAGSTRAGDEALRRRVPAEVRRPDADDPRGVRVRRRRDGAAGDRARPRPDAAALRDGLAGVRGFEARPADITMGSDRTPEGSCSS